MPHTATTTATTTNARANCSGCQIFKQVNTWTPGQKQVWCKIHGEQN